MIKNAILHLVRQKEHWADLPRCHCGAMVNSVSWSTISQVEFMREAPRNRCGRCERKAASRNQEITVKNRSSHAIDTSGYLAAVSLLAGR